MVLHHPSSLVARTTTSMKRASQVYFPKRFLWKALPSVGMTCIQGLPAGVSACVRDTASQREE